MSEPRSFPISSLLSHLRIERAIRCPGNPFVVIDCMHQSFEEKKTRNSGSKLYAHLVWAGTQVTAALTLRRPAEATNSVSNAGVEMIGTPTAACVLATVSAHTWVREGSA